MLSNVDIIQELKSNELKIDKFDSNRLQPASYDLTVGEAFFTRIQQEGSPENQETVFVVRPGEAATILTAEKVYLGDGISGHVNLTNTLASRGVDLLNAGHIDPGWGKDRSGNIVGFELTAIVRNVSNVEVKLRRGEPLLTLTLDYLHLATASPYWKAKPPDDPQARRVQLSLKAQAISEFVETERKIERDIAGLRSELQSKVSWSELVRSLAWLVTALGIIMTLIASIVTTAARSPEIVVGTYIISVPAFLFGLTILLGLVLLVGFLIERRSRVPK